MIDTLTGGTADAVAASLAAAAALLLAGAGGAKLRQPAPTAAMLVRLAHRPARDRRRAAPLVRVLGAGELAVAAAVLATGARSALLLLAAAYLSFTAVAVALLRSGGARSSCGCFGSAHSPLGAAHVVLTVAASAAALAAARHAPGPGLGLLAGSPVHAVTGVAQAALLATLGYLAVTSLPALHAARRAAAPSAR